MASVIVGLSFSCASYCCGVWERRRRRRRKSHVISLPQPIIRLNSSPPLITNQFKYFPYCYDSCYYYPCTTITHRGLMRIDHGHGAENYSTIKASSNNQIVIDTTKRKMRKRVLLLDIMDTVVRDPFYQDIPAFFQMSLDELIECKHPTAWIDFETGLIDEMELAKIFFKDGRPFDLEGLKNCMTRGFSYLPGMEELLSLLKQNNYEMHALTNYPIWYEMIEDKLKLSKYLSWSFCSCTIGKRKPDAEIYAQVVRRLDIEPENCIFIDDRMRNVEAAVKAGMVGLQFKDANTLRNDLSLLGIQIQYQKEEEEEEDVAS